VIRTAVLTVLALTGLALGAMAAPALAFEVKQAPAPRAEGPHFLNGGKILGMMPATASEPFRFGPSEQARAKAPMVVYDLKGGKPADRLDVTDPRDNPFMPQPERSSVSAH
jgi:hypothetical protein